MGETATALRSGVAGFGIFTRGGNCWWVSLIRFNHANFPGAIPGTKVASLFHDSCSSNRQDFKRQESSFWNCISLLEAIFRQLLFIDETNMTVDRVSASPECRILSIMLVQSVIEICT
jgi:hypothetical protein